MRFHFIDMTNGSYVSFLVAKQNFSEHKGPAFRFCCSCLQTHNLKKKTK